MHKLSYTLILVAIFTFSCKDKKPATPATPIINETATEEVDTLQEDTIVVEEIPQIEEPVIEETVGPYYVVVSSFVNEKNANVTLEKYKKLGYPAGIISREKGRNPEFLRVYLAQSNNKQEALKTATEISRQLNVRAWVLVNP